MDIEKTERGFDIGRFSDYYGEICSLQKSSLATDDCIWLGISNIQPKIMASLLSEKGVGWVNYPMHPEALINGRMHLTREQVKNLLPYLINFVETGELRK